MQKKIFIVLLLIGSFAASAQKNESGLGLFYLYVGETNANLNTNAKFSVSQEVLDYYPSISTAIDLEDDLNFPSTSQLFYIKGIAGRRFQVAATFFSLHRSGGSTLSKTFAFGENTYTVSAPVSGYFNTDYYSASLRHSFLRNEIVSAGLSLGFRYMKIAAGIRADSMGYVFDKSGSMDIPSVVPGVHASVSPLDNLLIRGSFEYISLRLNKTTGTVLEGNLSAEYYLLKYFGVGIGYSITNLKAEGLPDNDIYLEDVNYSAGGLQLYAALRF